MTDREMVTRSLKVEKDLDRLMRQREDVNWSGLLRQFLHEYAASGQGTEAALAVRLEQIENELSEARGRVARLEDERDRLEASLGEKRERRRDVFEAFSSLEVNAELTPANPAVQHHAERLGMTPETFLTKYREWSE